MRFGRAIILLCALSAACSRQVANVRQTIIPWAWERPEDLRFAPAERVAYLAATMRLSGSSIALLRRRQRLQIAPLTVAVPVIRVETDRRDRPALTAAQAAAAANAIATLPAVGRASEVQLDFDAVSSERSFYTALLRQLRNRIGAGKRISITALASWCMDDPWIEKLPIDEAVPMLFEMGRDSEVIRNRLARGEDFTIDLCRHSIGISTAEPLATAPPRRTVWVFSRSAWTPAEWQHAEEQIASWNRN